MMTLTAALAGADGPGSESVQPVWDRWNAMSPAERAGGVAEWNERHVSALEALDEHQLNTLRVPMSFLPEPLDATGLVGMRLGEHALHSWDVFVSFDPAAQIPAEAAALALQRAPMMMRWAGHADAWVDAPIRIAVTTVAPDHTWRLDIGDTVTLEPDAHDTDGRLTLPAETFLRLLTGRLRSADVARVEATGPATIEDLRLVFRGF